MTIASTITRVGYTSNGATTQYAFPNKIFSASDLIVTLTDPVSGILYSFTNQANGTLGLSYRVDNVDVDSGCTVVFSGVQTAGWAVDIRSATPELQSTSVKNQGQFLPELHEEAFDRLTRETQDLYRLTYTYGIHGPDSEVTAWPALPAPAARKNLFLGFDSSGALALGTPIATLLTQGLVGSTLWPQTAKEAAAGVVPTFFYYPPYDVRRYGARGDGVTDDTTAFNQAGSIGVDIAVPETGNTYVLSSQVAGLFYAVGQPRFTTTYQRVGLVTDIGTAADNNNTGVATLFPRGVASGLVTYGGTSMLVIGDSITQGTGVTQQVNSWGWLFTRSVMNHCNEGVFNDSGYGYAHYLQWLLGANLPGVTTTGTLVAAGVWGSRLQLATGQSLTMTLKEIKSFDVIYDATASAGATFQIKLNGTTISNVVVSGAGLKITAFPTILKANNILTRLSDVITVTCSAGTLQLCSVVEQKNSDENACVVSMGGQSGYAYQDYTSSANMDELAFYLNNPVNGANKILVCQLGTNNLYNAGKALSPTAMIAQIQTLLTGMNTRCTNLQFAISVPPKSLESTFPLILGTFKYEDYVRAIVAFAVANNVTLLRNDLSVLNTGVYYADGLHPNDAGASIMAGVATKTFGIKFDPWFKSINFTLDQYLTQVRTDVAIPMNGTWGPFSALPGFAARAHLVAGNLVLSGVVVPNGSGSTQIGALPAGFIPDSQDRYVLINKNVSGGALGTARLQINHTTGALILDALPTNDVALDGVCIPLYKNIEA